MEVLFEIFNHKLMTHSHADIDFNMILDHMIIGNDYIVDLAIIEKGNYLYKG
jgi:hypothetical protein